MRRFLIKAALFVLPIVAYCLVVLLVDPYDRFGTALVKQDSTKAAVARIANHELWTLIYSDHHPSPNILLGDSKMMRLKSDEIARVSGLQFANLGMAGASTSDILDLFWHAADRVPLGNVVIGVNIEGLNRHTNRNLFKGAASVAATPLLYISSRNVLTTTTQLLGMRLLHRVPPSEAPPMNRDEFWQYQLAYGATRNLQGFSFDDDAMAEFARVGAYCRSHGIRLRFIVLPTQADVHQRIKDFGLGAQWAALPTQLRAIAETTDFDSDNPMTMDRANFEDPFHMTDATAQRVVDEFFAKP